MSFFGKLGAFLKNFAMEALRSALHGVSSAKIPDLLKHVKTIVLLVEEAFPGKGRGDEKYKAAMKILLGYAASEGIKLLEFQADKLLGDAFSSTLGAQKVGLAPTPSTTTDSTPPPSA